MTAKGLSVAYFPHFTGNTLVYHQSPENSRTALSAEVRALCKLCAALTCGPGAPPNTRNQLPQSAQIVNTDAPFAEMLGHEVRDILSPLDEMPFVTQDGYS